MALPKVFATLLSALAMSAALGAQCSPVPGSGCPGSTRVGCSGSSRIGQGFAVTGAFGGTNLMFVGACLSTPAPIPPAAFCGSPPGCTLVVDPQLHFVVPFVVATFLPIPNDPRLVGTGLCLQCTMTSGSCLFPSLEAVSITIQA